MISSRDIRDRNELSGSSYYMAEAFKEYITEVDILEPLLPSRRTLTHCLNNMDILVRALSQKVLQCFWSLRGKEYYWERTLAMSQAYARRLKRELAKKEYDLIVADKGSIVIAHLDTNVPILYFSDATFRLIAGYYPGYKNLCEPTKRQSDLLERMAIEKAAACLYRSEWAARSAIDDYGAEPAKVFVTSLGPNIDKQFIPSRIDVADRFANGTCRLLLIGLNWHRKGCDTAIEATRILKDEGIDAHLTICGCKKPAGVTIPHYVNWIPSLNKNDSRDMKTLVDLYHNTTFFLMPTRAEAYGIVLIEACAFGIPIIAANTGGVSEIVRHEKTGLLIDDIENPNAYAASIRHLCSNKQLYRQYAEEARAFHEGQANWRCWAEKVKEAIERILSASKHRGDGEAWIRCVDGPLKVITKSTQARR